MTQQGVTESKAGTMPNTDGQAKVTPSKEGGTPGVASKVSPEETPKFTQKQYDEAVLHAAKSEGSRVTKAMETREQAVTDAVAKEVERQATKDAKELEDAKDDPAELTLVQRRQKATTRDLAADERERELTAREATNKAEIDAAKATKFEADVFEIAKEQGVDASWLKELGITDLEQLKTIAKGVSNKEATGPDPGGTKGGGEVTEQQRLDKLYPTTAKKS